MRAESLYTPIIVENSRDDRFRGKPDQPEIYSSRTGSNPVCGDEITWFLLLSGDKKTVSDIRFEAKGCLISKASAALLAGMIHGNPVDVFYNWFDELEKITQKDSPEPDAATVQISPWLALAQVKAYPARRKCALLAWETLKNLLEDKK